jgi:hypothetical protein
MASVATSQAMSMQMLKVIISGNRQYSSAGIGAFVAVPQGANRDLATLAYDDVTLSVGDEIVVHVVDVETADRPANQNTGEARVKIEAGSNGA